MQEVTTEGMSDADLTSTRRGRSRHPSSPASRSALRLSFRIESIHGHIVRNRPNGHHRSTFIDSAAVSESLVGVVGYHVRLTRERSPVRTWYETFFFCCSFFSCKSKHAYLGDVTQIHFSQYSYEPHHVSCISRPRVRPVSRVPLRQSRESGLLQDDPTPEALLPVVEHRELSRRESLIVRVDDHAPRGAVLVYPECAPISLLPVPHFAVQFRRRRARHRGGGRPRRRPRTFRRREHGRVHDLVRRPVVRSNLVPATDVVFVDASVSEHHPSVASGASPAIQLNDPTRNLFRSLSTL